MPDLKNGRHERFAQAVAAGRSLVDAYQHAGYRRHDGNASALRGNQKISGRIAELQGEARKRIMITVESLTGELEAARQLALQSGNPAAAVSATMGKARLHRLLTEKQEISVNLAERIEQARKRAQTVTSEPASVGTTKTQA